MCDLKRTLSGVLLFFITIMSSANAETVLSLEDAVSLALKNNETLEQAQEDKEVAHERVKEAKGALFPKLEASYNYSRYFEIRDIPQYYFVAPNTTSNGNFLGLSSDTEPLGPTNPLGWHTVPLYGPAKEENEHTASISASQVLYTSGRVGNYLKAAKYGSQGANQYYAVEKRNLVFNVREAYLNTLLAKQALLIAKESLENTQNDHQVIQNKFKEGLSSKFDVMQHAVSVQNYRVNVNKAKNDLILAENYLKTIIGIRFEESLSLKDTFNDTYPAYNFERLKEVLLTNDPMLKTLEHGIAAGEYLLKAKKADYYPTLAAFGSAERSGDSEDFFPKDDEQNNTIVAGFQLTVPLYEGGIKRAKVSQALHDLRKSKLERLKVEKGLLLDLQNAYLSYLSSQKELETAASTVNVAQIAYDLAQLRYHTGMGSRSDLQDAALALSNTRLFVYKSKRDVNFHLYKIFRYCPNLPRNKK